MVPAALTVAGTTVKFQMTQGHLRGPHRDVRPGRHRGPASYLGAIAASLSRRGSTRGVLPERRVAVSLSPTTHGNGFSSSGALDLVKAVAAADSASVKFDTPGTYTYYCLIHPFMRGTVTVQ